MVEYNRELDKIQTDLDRLHERSQSNKSNITAHEAVCEERYNNIVEMFNRLDERIEKLESNVAAIHEVATQGKTSLKTILWLGAMTAGVLSFLVMLTNFIGPR